MQHDPKAGDELTIYHNPSCSKSRETLALIEASGVTPRIVEYLKTPPGEAELTDIVRKLGIGAAELVRTTEPLYRDKYSGKTLDDAQWIKALTTDPILLQRPIVVRGNDAVIGRPPENVKRLLR
jgi:arsenate reductase